MEGKRFLAGYSFLFCGKHGCFCVPVRRFSACSSGIGYGLRRSRRAQGALRAFFPLGAQQGRMHPFQPRIPLDAKKAAGRVHQVFQNPRRNLVVFRKNPKRRSVFSKQQRGGFRIFQFFIRIIFQEHRNRPVLLCFSGLSRYTGQNGAFRAFFPSASGSKRRFCFFKKRFSKRTEESFFMAQRTELLAPAGSWERIVAAVESG